MISLDCNCDECRKRLDSGDEIYCATCVGELKQEIEALEKRLVEMEEAADE